MRLCKNYRTAIKRAFPMLLFHFDSTKAHNLTHSQSLDSTNYLSTMTLTGSCLCGAITYFADGNETLPESLEKSVLTGFSGYVHLSSLPLHRLPEGEKEEDTRLTNCTKLGIW